MVVLSLANGCSCIISASKFASTVAGVRVVLAEAQNGCQVDVTLSGLKLVAIYFYEFSSNVLKNAFKGNLAIRVYTCL